MRAYLRFRFYNLEVRIFHFLVCEFSPYSSEHNKLYIKETEILQVLKSGVFGSFFYRFDVAMILFY